MNAAFRRAPELRIHAAAKHLSCPVRNAFSFYRIDFGWGDAYFLNVRFKRTFGQMAHTDLNRRDRILDAAENAFGERGFDGASLREIVLEAKVNLATVYYYFGSKHGLMEAVLKRRFGPLGQEQLALLREAQRRDEGGAPGVEAVLRALLLPPLKLVVGPAAKRRPVARLVGRIVTEPSGRTQELLRNQHAEIRAAFLKALQASLPGLPLSAVRWRFEFVTGALAIILCNPRKLEQETRGACNPVDVDQVLAEMIRFFSHGFRAPSVSPAL